MSRLFLLLAVPLALAPAATPQEKKAPVKEPPPHTVLYAVPLVCPGH